MPGRAAVTIDPAIAEAEWTMSIKPDATILILHKGARSSGRNTLPGAERTLVWAGGQYKAEAARPGEAILTGGIPNLDLKATGSIQPVAENALKVEYNFIAAKAHDEIKGDVLDWKFDLDSPSFDTKPQAPVFFTGLHRLVLDRRSQPVDRRSFRRAARPGPLRGEPEEEDSN